MLKQEGYRRLYLRGDDTARGEGKFIPAKYRGSFVCIIDNNSRARALDNYDVFCFDTLGQELVVTAVAQGMHNFWVPFGDADRNPNEQM
jgi:hypothetical protein